MVSNTNQTSKSVGTEASCAYCPATVAAVIGIEVSICESCAVEKIRELGLIE